MVGFVSRAQWGARPGRNPGPFRPDANGFGVMIHWRGGGTPQSNHANCAAEVRAQQQRDMNNGHADIMYSWICCINTRLCV